MPDLNTATQDAIFDALNIPAVTTEAPVYQHPPDGAEPPMHVLGDFGVENIGGKGGGLDRIEFEIITVIREQRRATLFERMAEVRQALEDVAITAPGVILSPPAFLASDDDISEDGVTYIGTQRFETIAQPA